MKLLSYAGRLTLISSVAASMPVYNMATNKVPISTCRELDAIVRKFWWIGNAEKNRFMAYKAWDKICQPKFVGGLGLRRFEDMNRALISKLAWSLAQNQDPPWVKCLLSKYCSRASFWAVEPRNGDSFLWKSILSTRNIVLKGSVTLAAEGSSIDFWAQPWIPWLDPIGFGQLMGSLDRNTLSITTVADISTNGRWNREVVTDVFGADIGRKIMEIPRIPLHHHDQVVWKGNENGIFSVKSAYRIDQEHRFGQRRSLWRWV
uniref:Uncharacterized protein n=1 Tax=Cannabis sativa TaxID=3483 RepID=A0A803PE83_CANSA